MSIGTSSFNRFINPKNFAKLSPSSSSDSKRLYSPNISMKILIMKEKVDTPNKRINAPTSRSRSLLGCISPNPTVDKDVKAKYVKEIVFSLSVYLSR